MIFCIYQGLSCRLFDQWTRSDRKPVVDTDVMQPSKYIGGDIDILELFLSLLLLFQLNTYESSSYLPKLFDHQP